MFSSRSTPWHIRVSDATDRGSWWPLLAHRHTRSSLVSAACAPKSFAFMLQGHCPFPFHSIDYSMCLSSLQIRYLSNAQSIPRKSIYIRSRCKSCAGGPMTVSLCIHAVPLYGSGVDVSVDRICILIPPIISRSDRRRQNNYFIPVT